MLSDAAAFVAIKRIPHIQKYCESNTFLTVYMTRNRRPVP